MPKSSTAELAALRDEVFARDGFACKWPGCEYERAVYKGPLQLAHIQHRGMGGSVIVNTPSHCVTLCRYHHDIFDGRDGSANVKRELALMLRTVAGI